LRDGEPFGADFAIRRRAIVAWLAGWLGATEKDVFNNFDWKIWESELENAIVVGI